MTEKEFPTNSPINIEKLTGQNKRLFDYLKAGNKIHCMSDAMTQLRIGYLNSRCSDLKNKFNVPLKSEYVTITYNEEKTTVKSYWI